MKINFDKCKMYDGNFLDTIETQKNFDRLFKLTQSQGFAQFCDDKGWNWVNIKGEPFSDKRYYRVDDFTEEGFASFEDDNGSNWVNKNGQELSNKRYNNVGNFIQGFAWFKYVDDYTYINTLGFEFRSNNLNYDSSAKDNERLKQIEDAIYSEFPVGSMKYFIFSKFFS